MDLTMLPTIVELVKANLFVTVLVGLVYGVIFVLIFREIRTGHQSLERIEASAERIATMVRELHNR